jgi:hypothetical protein
VIPDLQAALVCEDVRFEVSGANTIVGVVNAVRSPQFPLRVMKMCVFTRWGSGEGQFTQTTRLLRPDEEILASTNTSFHLNNQELQATNIAVFGGVEFSSPGQYTVEILLDEELTLRFPLPVLGVKKKPGN